MSRSDVAFPSMVDIFRIELSKKKVVRSGELRERKRSIASVRALSECLSARTDRST